MVINLRRPWHDVNFKNMDCYLMVMTSMLYRMLGENIPGFYAMPEYQQRRVFRSVWNLTNDIMFSKLLCKEISGVSTPETPEQYQKLYQAALDQFNNGLRTGIR
jgi:hypothetical protein